jgi:tetratricopeptide (TPR) repeat protein
MSRFEPLLEELVDELPEPRRSLHRQAVEVATRFMRDGAPFALMLRTYGATLTFVESENSVGSLFENLFLDRLQPAGIGVIQVQIIDHGGPGSALYAPERPPIFAVCAPSLFIAIDNWLEPVTYLIERAELIVVLLSVATPGVLMELETIVARGRADRTVVLVSGENPGAPLEHTTMLLDGDTIPDTASLLLTPILARFTRVLWVGDLDPHAPIDTFVFRDLTERLQSIRLARRNRRRKLVETGDLDRVFPVTWKGVREAFEKLAMSSRAINHSTFAAQYFGSAARLAVLDGDIDAAVDATTAQAGLLSLLGRDDHPAFRPALMHQHAQSVLTGLLEEIDGLARQHWSSDPAIVLAHARLVAERARMLIRTGQLDEARRTLEDEYSRCQGPLNRRALSALRTMLAWTLRATSDVDGVLKAGKEGFELAKAENAPWEMARALTVIGATLYDLGGLADAANALWNAAEIIPRDRYHEDAWLIRERLADVFERAGRLDDARSMLQEAVRLAEDGSLGAWAEWTRERLSELRARLNGVPSSSGASTDRPEDAA